MAAGQIAQPFANHLWQGPVDHHSLEIDHRATGGHRRGQRAGRLIQPRRDIYLEVRPVLRLTPQLARVFALHPQSRLKRADRGEVDQLPLDPVPVGDGQRTKGPRIALVALEHRMIQHDPSADEGTHKEIDIVAVFPPDAKDMFGPAGRRGVVDHMDRQTRDGLCLGNEIGILPRGELLGGGADQLVPVPQLERGGHSDPAQTAAQGVGHVIDQTGKSIAQEPEYGIGQGIVIGLAQLVAHLAGEVQHQQIRTAPPHLEANRKHPVRVQRVRHRRLAHPALDRIALV